MAHWVENPRNSTSAKMTLYPDPIKLKKYPILSQILTPFCPKIKGSIQDQHNRPDLTLLIRASETVGKVLKKGDIVVYESTVYPGCTEQDCVPVLERVS